MWEKFASLFKVPELRKRILFTLGAIIVIRLGTHISVPGVNWRDIGEFQSGGLLDFMNMFSGGALQKFSLFALGVTPYINASIIFSLLTSVIPKLKELQQQGREGRRKITSYTRYATVGLAIVQGVAFSTIIKGAFPIDANLWFYTTTIVTLTTGTIFLMWLGERITENGIGNGISLIIMISILSRFPTQLAQLFTGIGNGQISAIWAPLFIVLLIVVVAGMTMVQQGQRKISIQYAKRTMGRRIYGGHSSHLPLKVNQSGVIPVIFAMALLTFPITIFSALNWTLALDLFAQGSLLYIICYVALIFFFTYFYSSIVFDPNDVAKNIREAGGFIPGVRPGKPTAEYITAILGRMLLVGAVFLSGVAVLPYILSSLSKSPAMFLIGGTSLLIVVGVGIDTLMQIETHLVMRHYDSLTKSGGLLGRRG
ncbi:preprotein translocase subunit SecY [Candidatus Bipolaricaulota bacterium]|jgi:preprotein translocase subunit SecY|nr:preprotein translocase subunit SecY [Candidatus Bipolaricaulota bacterium]TFH11699.1 MAG: preprotein translocase subunit SecY [Candidatus Atribacteria bacterium]